MHCSDCYRNKEKIESVITLKGEPELATTGEAFVNVERVVVVPAMPVERCFDADAFASQ